MKEETAIKLMQLLQDMKFHLEKDVRDIGNAIEKIKQPDINAAMKVMLAIFAHYLEHPILKITDAKEMTK